ncbi:hypothetical protein [Dongia sedimenti]|uniref:Outer membrane lipoprotein n=1 Tax=Dongia sedimenti TaxID=3064282 RepID=A0ABU0YL23_9PROT|nr:hypothetical protein [Rhodospirillaceae bacterium R-7]
MSKNMGAVVQAARSFVRMSAVVVAAALLLGACVSGYQSEYNAPDGKVLLVSQRDWAAFQKYLGKIGSTRDGAFAMGVTNGRSDGWASTSCSYDACIGGNAATQAMRMCREGGPCLLFASDDHILVNYKVEDE